jgi:predicted metal-dependent hydrolase
MEELAIKAYTGLYPEKDVDKRFSVRYSSKFNAYNANVKYYQDRLNFRLSRRWDGVSEEIITGLLQSLMNKVFRTNIMTINIELYNIFLTKAYQGAQKDDIEPELQASFERLNQRYFNGSVDMPNLVWGGSTRAKLGSYEFGSDTIKISSLFKGNPELIDYIMYHEMLHKKLKFRYTGSRSYHHTKEFRQMEKAYPNARELEQKLRIFLTRTQQPIKKPSQRPQKKQGPIRWFFS